MIEPGRTGYSDLVADEANRCLYVLYEAGEALNNPFVPATLTLAKIPVSLLHKP